MASASRRAAAWTPKRRVPRAVLALWLSSSVGCNALLGNSEHEVADGAASDAQGEAGPSDTGTQDTRPTDSGVHPMQSCAPAGAGKTDCGPKKESCCTTSKVPGGTFFRSYDGVTNKSKADPATVSAFQLDKYEVTVGRFREFVKAVVAGWRPEAASGKHVHLHGGKGVALAGGAYEPGWNPSDGSSTNLPTTTADWTAALTLMLYSNWTPSSGANERRPINAINWYQAYAFCIWDGGFLPTEAEWNDAASGGGGATGQRVYPWSSPPTSSSVDCMRANYLGSSEGSLGFCDASGTNDVGSESPAGDGAFGHADLAGNVWEWNLDDYAASYVTPCDDCANLTFSGQSSIRGGSFDDLGTALVASHRRGIPASASDNFIGVRCARAP